MKSDIVLSTGAVVVHSPMANGATAADKADGNPMTEEEWQEYCAILVQSENRISLQCLKGGQS
jgi:hypothetical protein